MPDRAGTAGRHGPQLVEASRDLYATPLGHVPADRAAAAACRRSSPASCSPSPSSFDDFIIAFFVAGADTTLPIYVFSSIRRGVTPEINAIGTMVLAVSLMLMITAQLLLRRRRDPTPN